ncbi:hypothetical protein PO124_18100 [Bacillus licheniformis]|nr:hypothetical protein [Bacillus licheniformis]
MNLWDYEYGCLDGLPDQADRVIGQIVHEDLLWAIKGKGCHKGSSFMLKTG